MPRQESVRGESRVFSVAETWECQWYGEIYRVWHERILLGTFRKQDERWIAEPFYKNRQYIKLDYSLQRSFNSEQEAIKYIVGTSSF